MSYVTVRQRNHFVRPVNQWRTNGGLLRLDELRCGGRTPQDNPVSNSFPKPRPRVRLQSKALEQRAGLIFPDKEDALSGWTVWKEELLPDLPARYEQSGDGNRWSFYTCKGQRVSPAYHRTRKQRDAIKNRVNQAMECCGEVPLPRSLSRFLREYFNGAYDVYYRPLKIRVPSLPSCPVQFITKRGKHRVG